MDQETLDTILTEHQAWLEQKGGRQADLTMADLRGVDLHGVNLRYAELQGAVLDDANLNDTKLGWASLSGASLERASLQRADLEAAEARGTNFTGADFQQASMTAVDAQNALFEGASLEHAALRGGRFAGANFQKSSLAHATLVGSDLTDTDLQRVDCTGAVFLEAKLNGADLGGAKLDQADMRGTDMRGVRLTEATQEGTDLRGAALEADASPVSRRDMLDTILTEHQTWLETGGQNGHPANLEMTDLAGMDLGGVNLRGAKFHGARLEGANLREANLAEADMSFTRAEKADFSAASLEAANLDHADLGGATLQVSSLRRANFTEANLYRADLQRVDATQANFTEANLNSADLTHAQLPGSNFHGADLTEAKLNGANLEGADLQRAWLISTELEGANLRRTILEREAELVYTESGGPLNQRDLNEILGFAGVHADMEYDSWLEGDGDLPPRHGINFKGQDLRGLNFIEAAKGAGVGYQKAEFQDADLRNARMQGLDLGDANFQGADLRGARLQKAVLEGANFEGADLRGVSFRGANLKDANLEGAVIDKDTFRGARMNGEPTMGEWWRERVTARAWERVGAFIDRRGAELAAGLEGGGRQADRVVKAWDQTVSQPLERAKNWLSEQQAGVVERVENWRDERTKAAAERAYPAEERVQRDNPPPYPHEDTRKAYEDELIRRNRVVEADPPKAPPLMETVQQRGGAGFSRAEAEEERRPDVSTPGPTEAAGISFQVFHSKADAEQYAQHLPPSQETYIDRIKTASHPTGAYAVTSHPPEEARELVDKTRDQTVSPPQEREERRPDVSTPGPTEAAGGSFAVLPSKADAEQYAQRLPQSQESRIDRIIAADGPTDSYAVTSHPPSYKEAQAACEQILERPEEARAAIAQIADPADRAKATQLMETVQRSEAALQRTNHRAATAELDR